MRRVTDSVCDGKIHPRHTRQRVDDRLGEHGTAERGNYRVLVVDQPVVAVGVPAEEIFGGNPRIAGLEETSHGSARKIGGESRAPEQQSDLVFGALTDKSVSVLEEPTTQRVVCRQPHLRATRQRAPLGTNFGACNIGKNHVASVDA